MRLFALLALLLALPALALDEQVIRPTSAPGAYAMADWKRDFPDCVFEDGVAEKRLAIVDQQGEPWWQVNYAAGQIGPDKGGCGWRWPFSKKAKPKAQVRYAVLFEPGFDFVKGGKLPGLCGGPKTITGGDSCTGFDGWSARLMWRKDGRGQAYVYHPNMTSKYGDEFDFPEDFRFGIGQPVEVRIAVTINTIGQRDGSLRVWTSLPQQGERLMVERTDM